MNSLITPNEVKIYSPVGSDYNTDITKPFIIMKEEKIFNLCFGFSFYEDLLNELIDYESNPNYQCSFRQNVNYTVGHIVTFTDGKLFVCTQDTTGSQLPSNVQFWQVAPKFSNADYNALWNRYLCQILAFSILNTSIVYEAINATNKGLVRRKTESMDAAKLTEIDTFTQNLSDDIQDSVYNMDLYIRRNPEKFPLYKPLLDEQDSCKTDACSNQNDWNFGFNVDGSQYANRPTLDEL